MIDNEDPKRYYRQFSPVSLIFIRFCTFESIPRMDSGEFDGLGSKNQTIITSLIIYFSTA